MSSLYDYGVMFLKRTLIRFLISVMVLTLNWVIWDIFIKLCTTTNFMIHKNSSSQ